jgi:hypothetical protein
VIYNASVVNFYNATGSLARFENKNILFCFEKRSSLLQRWRCKFKNRRIGSSCFATARPSWRQLTHAYTTGRIDESLLREALFSARRIETISALPDLQSDKAKRKYFSNSLFYT